MKAPKTLTECLALGNRQRAKNPQPNESRVDRFARKSGRFSTFRCFKRALASATTRKVRNVNVFGNA